MHISISQWIRAIAVLALVFAGCESEEKKSEEEKEAPAQTAVGVLELPVSLRMKGAPPPNAHEVAINPTELQVNGKKLLDLNAGKFADGDVSGTAVPKLSSALGSPSRSMIALELHATVPYRTVVLTLNAAQSAGIRNATFRVRKPGGSPETGWLDINGFKVIEPTDDVVSFDTVGPRPWSEFVNVWEGVAAGCMGATSGNCSPKKEKIADGGTLQIILFASGDGVNMEFKRIGGPSIEELEKNEEIKQERGEIKILLEMPPEIVEAYMELPFETAAGFQFRGREAVVSPSALSATMAPVCGKTACGVVMKADNRTLTIRYVSLIGAAFPDGTPAPTVAFVIPE
jgi:hypothetical protein